LSPFKLSHGGGCVAGAFLLLDFRVHDSIKFERGHDLPHELVVPNLLADLFIV
jgi:hypothetical protein